MRGLLSATVPDSSFAEAHRVLLPEPADMEDEDEEEEVRRMKKKVRETVKSATWRVEEKSEQTLRMKHG